MKNFLAVVLLTLILACGALAQQPSGGSDQGSSPRAAEEINRADNDRDWGWIGLLGLAGLMGLRRRQEVKNVERDVRGGDLRRAG